MNQCSGVETLKRLLHGLALVCSTRLRDRGSSAHRVVLGQIQLKERCKKQENGHMKRLLIFCDHLE